MRGVFALGKIKDPITKVSRPRLYRELPKEEKNGMKYKPRSREALRGKGGLEVTYDRIVKYEKLCRYMVHSYLPAGSLWEASMNRDDLLNQLRYEVVMALKNTFDPELAMTSTIKDPETREKHLAKKRSNPEAALEAAERLIVYDRINNYLRRTRWKFRADIKGGKSVSMEYFMYPTDYSNSSELKSGIFTEAYCLKDKEAEKIKESLLDRMESEGPEAVKREFESLDPILKERVLDMLKDFSSKRCFVEFVVNKEKEQEIEDVNSQ